MCLRDFCSGVQDSWLVSGPSCEAPYIAVTLQNEKKKKIVSIVVILSCKLLWTLIISTVPFSCITSLVVATCSHRLPIFPLDPQQIQLHNEIHGTLAHGHHKVQCGVLLILRTSSPDMYRIASNYMYTNNFILISLPWYCLGFGTILWLSCL